MNFKPDLLILVDYPGFNLRIAKWAKSQKIPVYYYISPQIWAWKESRIHQIKQTVSRMYCILPFEKDFYMKHSLNVSYFGHPLLDEVNKFILSYNVDKGNLNIIKQYYMSSKIDYEDSCLINNFDSKNLIPLFKMQFMPFPAGCESYSELIFNNTFDGEFTKGSSFIVYDIRKSEGKVQRIRSIKQ